MRLAAVVAATVALQAFAGVPARAEVVMLRSADEVGQGWLYLDRTGVCRVVTAGHIVRKEGPDELIAPVLEDRRSRQIVTSSPRIPDPDLDVGFLTVEGEIARQGCSESRLSPVSLDSLLSRTFEAQLEFTTRGEVVTLPLVRRAASRDELGGRVIEFETKRSDAMFRQGMSGGMVFVGTRPVALLFGVDTDTNAALAVRLDAVAALEPPGRVDAGKKAPEPLVDFDLVVQAGTLVGGDARGGVDTALTVMPDDRGNVSLEVFLGEAMAVVGLTGAASPAGLKVFVEGRSAAGAPPLYMSACATGDTVSCQFLKRSLTSLVVSVRTSEPLTLWGLEILR